jgi:hypothetical protein
LIQQRPSEPIWPQIGIIGELPVVANDRIPDREVLDEPVAEMPLQEALLWLASMEQRAKLSPNDQDLQHKLRAVQEWRRRKGK